ncbi:hypothetical protein HPP92_006795 [Vanilla planifolia]|uniref:Uncharacterized protein n=1 Tax=Vanilla planifolia TaxID=51239 RepID=A0A835RBG5_VANPL|nr:hypothetical protein HPP92_006795 [Vanilla planifolia]
MSSYPHISPKLRRLSHQNHNSKPSSSFNSSPPCDHSPLATFDLLILVLVLFSCTFLIGSTLTYIFRCLSLMLPSTRYAISAASLRDDPIPYLTGFLVFLAASAATVEISCYRSCLWSRRCGNRRCRGLRNAVEFDVQLQTEECIRLISSSDASASAASAAWKEIDELPWKGGNRETAQNMSAFVRNFGEWLRPMVELSFSSVPDVVAQLRSLRLGVQSVVADTKRSPQIWLLKESLALIPAGEWLRSDGGGVESGGLRDLSSGEQSDHSVSLPPPPLAADSRPGALVEMAGAVWPTLSPTPARLSHLVPRRFIR